MIPPREAQFDQGPECGAVCQMCQSALSVPRAKTSNRPSVLQAAETTFAMLLIGSSSILACTRVLTDRSHVRRVGGALQMETPYEMLEKDLSREPSKVSV